jgi:hypothetical protein
MHTHPEPSFIPLSTRTLRANERPNCRVTVVSGANSQPFPGPGQPNAWSAVASASAEDSQVKLQKNGDQITAIQVQCACGRIVELSCLYEKSPVLAPSPGVAPAAGKESGAASVRAATTPSQGADGVTPAPASKQG